MTSHGWSNHLRANRLQESSHGADDGQKADTSLGSSASELGSSGLGGAGLDTSGVGGGG
jgi:hypothetical protein